jgi:hypothetical protein
MISTITGRSNKEVKPWGKFTWTNLKTPNLSPVQEVKPQSDDDVFGIHGKGSKMKLIEAEKRH